MQWLMKNLQFWFQRHADALELKKIIKIYIDLLFKNEINEKKIK